MSNLSRANSGAGHKLKTTNRRITALVIAAMLSATAAGGCRAADMMLEWRDGKWMPIPPADVAPVEAPQRQPQPTPKAPYQARESDDPLGREPALAPRAPKQTVKTDMAPRPLYKPVGEPKNRVAAPKPAAAALGPENTFETALSFLWWVIRTAVWMLVALVVVANFRGILGFIDALFETAPSPAPATEPTADELQTEAVAASLAVDLRDLVQSEFSAADYRKQTEVLRALKDELDAEVEAARATIRRERARAKQQQAGKGVS